MNKLTRPKLTPQLSQGGRPGGRGVLDQHAALARDARGRAGQSVHHAVGAAAAVPELRGPAAELAHLRHAGGAGGLLGPGAAG